MSNKVVEVSCLGVKQLRTLEKDNVDIFHSIQNVIEYINDQVDNGNIPVSSNTLIALSGLSDIQIKITKAM